MKRSYMIPILAAMVLLVSILACGSGSETEPTVAPTKPSPTDTPSPAGIEIRKAVLAHDIDDDHKPVDPDTEFTSDEKIWLSITLKGRPKKGVVSVQFYLHDDLLVEAEGDLADVNSSVIFSIGEDTYLNFWLTGDDTLPISQAYRADVFYDGDLVDSYAFSVVPPEDAIPAVVSSSTLWFPMSPAWIIRSTPAKASATSGRKWPWVSEIIPTRKPYSFCASVDISTSPAFTIDYPSRPTAKTGRRPATSVHRSRPP